MQHIVHGISLNSRREPEPPPASPGELVDDPVVAAIRARGEVITFDAYEAELHAQADDSLAVTEIRYRAAAAAVEELGQAMLAEAGLTGPTEAQLVDIYRAAEQMLAVEVQ